MAQEINAHNCSCPAQVARLFSGKSLQIVVSHFTQGLCLQVSSLRSFLVPGRPSTLSFCRVCANIRTKKCLFPQTQVHELLRLQDMNFQHQLVLSISISLQTLCPALGKVRPLSHSIWLIFNSVLTSSKNQKFTYQFLGQHMKLSQELPLSVFRQLCSAIRRYFLGFLFLFHFIFFFADQDLHFVASPSVEAKSTCRTPLPLKCFLRLK